MRSCMLILDLNKCARAQHLTMLISKFCRFCNQLVCATPAKKSAHESLPGRHRADCTYPSNQSRGAHTTTACRPTLALAMCASVRQLLLLME